MKITEKWIEEKFEEWLKTEPNKNKLPESSFETYASKFGFAAAIALLSPIIERQTSALEKISKDYGRPSEMMIEARETLAWVSEQMGDPPAPEEVKNKISEDRFLSHFIKWPEDK